MAEIIDKLIEKLEALKTRVEEEYVFDEIDSVIDNLKEDTKIKIAEVDTDFVDDFFDEYDFCIKYTELTHEQLVKWKSKPKFEEECSSEYKILCYGEPIVRDMHAYDRECLMFRSNPEEELVSICFGDLELVTSEEIYRVDYDIFFEIAFKLCLLPEDHFGLYGVL